MTAREGETVDERADRYANAILYFIDHPDAIDNEFMRSFINGVRTEVEALEAEQQLEEAAKAAPLLFSFIRWAIRLGSCLVGI
jgi:hypothetical protein